MNFLKKISVKTKVIFSFIISIFTFAAYVFFLNKKKGSLESSRETLEENNNILEKELEEKEQIKEDLDKKEKELRDELVSLYSKDFIDDEDISLEELDKFFKDKGY